MYVTNAYNPDRSSTSYLPYPGNPNTPCLWVAQNWTNSLRMAPGDPCYVPSLRTYTIGVRGATYTPRVTSTFQISASTTGVRRLMLGVQRPMQYVEDNRSEWSGVFIFTRLCYVNYDVLVHS